MAGLTPEVKQYARDAIQLLDDDVFAAVVQTGFGGHQSVDEGYTLGVPLLLLQGDKEPYSAFMGTTRLWAERDARTIDYRPGRRAQRESRFARIRERPYCDVLEPSGGVTRSPACRMRKLR